MFGDSLSKSRREIEAYSFRVYYINDKFLYPFWSSPKLHKYMRFRSDEQYKLSKAQKFSKFFKDLFMMKFKKKQKIFPLTKVFF